MKKHHWYLLVGVLIAGPLAVFASNISEWSTTAASNNSAPPNGAPENMAANTVNDTMREMMAASARWYTDTRGALTTSGSGNSYTLTTSSAHTTLSDQSLLAFIADRANTGAATLNVDGLGAKSIRIAGAALVSGDLVLNTAYVVVYNATADAYEILGTVSVLSVARGGTGATTAAAARTNLGITATGADTTYAFRANNLSDLASASTARTNLGVTATGADTTYAFRANNLSDLANAGTARTNLALGSIATQASSSVSITGGSLSGISITSGSITGITDLAVGDGGTGASTAANARTNLGLAIGSDVAAASHSHAATDITSGTLAVARGGTGQTSELAATRRWTLNWTIQSDPGGTPSGSPGDVFAYY